MGTHGRLEGLITAPSGWGGTVGGNAFSLTAGPYFLSSAATSGSSLIAALQTAMDAAHANTITMTLSAGESGTGKVTVTSSGALAITFDDELLALLGFESNLASGTSWTSDNQARSLWLPDCNYKMPAGGSWRGKRESDFFANEDAAGGVAAFMGRERLASRLSWDAVSRSRVWIGHETTVNASWERFVKDSLWGGAPWGAGPIRFYRDADSNSSFCTYGVPDFRDIRPRPRTEDWHAGRWRVEISRLLVSPEHEAYG